MKVFDDDGNYIEPKYVIKNGKEYDKFMEFWDRIDSILDKIYDGRLPRDLVTLTQEENEIVKECDNLWLDVTDATNYYNYNTATTHKGGDGEKEIKKLHKELVRKGIYTH